MNAFARSPRNTRRRQRGQSLVEFALVIPLILVMLFGILDLGRAVFAFNTLAESARQAARLAIVDQDVARITDEAIAYAPALGLSADNIEVCFKTESSAQRDCLSSTDDCSSRLKIGCLAIVTSATTFTPITPIISALVPPIELQSTSISPIDYVCPTATKSTCP